MENIILPKEFNPKKITFAVPRNLGTNGGKVIYISYAGKPLIFQTPEMSVPFGMSKWENDKYTLDLSFKGKETRENLQSFFDGLVELDKTLVRAGLDNCQTWFKKKYTSLDVVEALYTPTVKYAKDKTTGDITDKYPPTFKLNLPFRDGAFSCEVYDKNKNLVDLLNMETKGSRVSAIIRCTGIWIAGGKYGCSFKVMQMRVVPPTSFKGYAFKEIDDKVDDDIDENEELVSGSDAEKDDKGDAAVTTDTTNNANQEDDDDELIESSDDELEKAPKPVAVKTKTVTRKA